MQYMLAFHETAADFAARADAAAAGPYWGAWTAYIGAMAQAGIIVGGNGLQPPHTGTTVRVRDGARTLTDGATVHDGPYADSKEQLGGYFIIEVPDLDAALEWAARSPCASTGSTEVRPVLPPMPAP
jgi:hypothetical protein